MRFRYEKSLSTMVVFGVLMSSSAAHANNIYFSEDGLINLENSSLYANGSSVGAGFYHTCGSVLIAGNKLVTAAYCLGYSFRELH
ncbi:hypothetical protein [Delftia tsuruhatensis]|uniref:hypothetical protein n=1 Tax=Delftia tsuruhatensis TaxID=180282 RepID=UPI000A41CC4E|nr:hypothetical protein [Delftia tsuruhatensis]